MNYFDVRSITLPRRLSRPLGFAVPIIVAATVWFWPVPVTKASAKEGDVIRFQLTVNPKYADCLARYPGEKGRVPTADVAIVKEKVNDLMTITLHNFKPGLDLDVFTVQRSPFLADGNLDPTFSNFGFAWYQTDIKVNDVGEAMTQIRTVLLDEIFGFDPDVQLAPTPTYHVGVWFDSPEAAMSCGFDVNNPTPFNGEHQAGPLALITLPNKDTSVGPLFVPSSNNLPR